MFYINSISSFLFRQKKWQQSNSVVDRLLKHDVNLPISKKVHKYQSNHNDNN